MTAISKVSELPPEAIEAYWSEVVADMTGVFGKTAEEARDAVEGFRSAMADMSDMEALLVYHDPARRTAEDLADALRPAT